MPKSLGGILGFIVSATIAFMVGSFIYNRFVGPVVGKALQKAA